MDLTLTLFYFELLEFEHLMIYRKPPNIGPQNISPPPVYKPTTCTNAHLIPNISPPPEYQTTCLSQLFITITTINHFNYACLTLVYHYYNTCLLLLH